MKHYAIEEWVDFNRGVVGAGASRCDVGAPSGRMSGLHPSFWFPLEIVRYLCEGCRSEAPEAALRLARAIFPSRISNGPKRGSRLPVEMIFDSLLMPATAGLRSSWQVGWQGLYRAGDCSVDLRIEPELKSSRAAVIGQITSHVLPAVEMGNLPVSLRAGKLVVAETVSNRFGEFQMEYEQQTQLKLCISFRDSKSIQVPLKKFTSQHLAATAGAGCQNTRSGTTVAENRETHMSRRLHIPMRLPLLIALFSLGAFAEDFYFVKVQGDVNELARRHGLTVVKSLGGSAANLHVLSSSGRDPQTVLHSLGAEFSVRTVESDSAVVLPGIRPASAVVRPAASTTAISISSTLVRYHNSFVASGYLNQPATRLINLANAQNLATGAGIVATIDTGADFTHPGLVPALTAGWDFVNNLPLGQELADINTGGGTLSQETTPILDQETTPILDGGTAIVLTQETTPILDQETTPILDGTKYPAYGHGTMVASLIHLVAPDARIMPLRAFGANGSATVSQIVAAIHYAVEHKADVINMSFSISVGLPGVEGCD